MKGPSNQHVVAQVESSEQVLAGSWQRRLACGVALAVFACCTLGAALIDLAFPVAPRAPVGAEMVRRQELERSASLLDGTLADWVEAQHKDHSRTRRWGLNAYVPQLFRFFDEAPKGTVVGADHTTFLEGRIEVAQLAGMSTQQRYERTAGFLKALQRRLLLLGSELLVVPIPRKAVLLADRLPRGIDPRVGEDIAILQTLRAYEVSFVDLLGIYTSHRGECVYERTGTHWTPTGMVVAAWATAGVLAGDKAVRLPQTTTRLDERDARTAAHSLGVDSGPIDWLRHYKTALFRFAPEDVAVVFGSVTTRDPRDLAIDVLLAGTSFSSLGPDVATTFVQGISAATGYVVWTSALPGRAPSTTLWRGIDQLAGVDLPRHVVLELPMHFLTSQTRRMLDSGDLLAALPLPAAGRLQSLLAAPAKAGAQAEAGSRFAIPRTMLAGKLRAAVDGEGPAGSTRFALAAGESVSLRLRWQSFLYPRDGTVAVQLRGSVQGTPLRMTVDRGFETLAFGWDSQRHKLLVPTAGGGIGHQFDCIATAAGGSAVLDLVEIDVVTDLDLDAGVAAVAKTVDRAGAGCSQRFSFALAPSVGDDCIGIQLSGPLGLRGEVEVRAEFADGSEAVLLEPREVLGDACMLLPLRAWRGRALMSVQVRLLPGPLADAVSATADAAGPSIGRVYYLRR